MRDKVFSQPRLAAGRGEPATTSAHAHSIGATVAAPSPAALQRVGKALMLAVASKAWSGLTGAIGQQAALILLGAALLGGTMLLEPPEVPVRGIGEWSD